uniref:Uncharacterized protein n=1 Tax=Anguilla anguilla TaxID=7936 RepID=A0A0E9PIZ4_ANGAN
MMKYLKGTMLTACLPLIDG